jgi:hypothetical protein
MMAHAHSCTWFEGVSEKSLREKRFQKVFRNAPKPRAIVCTPAGGTAWKALWQGSISDTAPQPRPASSGAAESRSAAL